MTPTTHAARKALTDLDQTILDYRQTAQDRRLEKKWTEAVIWEAKADALDLEQSRLRGIFCDVERETTASLNGFAARMGL